MALYLYKGMVTGINPNDDFKLTFEFVSEDLRHLRDKKDVSRMLFETYSPETNEALLRHIIYEITPTGLQPIEKSTLSYRKENTAQPKDLQ